MTCSSMPEVARSKAERSGARDSSRASLLWNYAAASAGWWRLIRCGRSLTKPSGSSTPSSAALRAMPREYGRTDTA